MARFWAGFAASGGVGGGGISSLHLEVSAIRPFSFGPIPSLATADRDRGVRCGGPHVIGSKEREGVAAMDRVAIH